MEVEAIEVKCGGCGHVYEVETNESFVCELCQTLVEPAKQIALPVSPVKPSNQTEADPSKWNSAGPSSRRPMASAELFQRSPFKFESCPGGLRVASCLEELSDAVIPESWRGQRVVEIGDFAFRGQGIQSLTLPESIETIGESAFENCFLLQRVKGGAPQMRIGEKAFQSCVQLRSVELRGAADASISAFAGCYQLGVANESAKYRKGE